MRSATPGTDRQKYSGSMSPGRRDAKISVMASEPFVVACLCAAWCRLCDDYAPIFDRVVSDLRTDGLRVESVWIDIEDEDDLIGDLDIETFPTVVVFDESTVRFAGPLTPELETLHRVLRATLGEERHGGDRQGGRPPAAEDDFGSFARRFRARRGPARDAPPSSVRRPD